MLSAHLEIFFRLPSDGNSRRLHPARVLTATPRTCTAELESAIPLEPGQELLIYYKLGGKFVQRPIRIDAMLRGSKYPVAAFALLGEPASANTRECFRVATNIAGLKADVAGEPNCPVIDLSATGFSIISKAPHAIGSTLSVAFSHEGTRYTGLACVQSTRDLGRGRVRYGMFCVTGRNAAGNLAAGLATMSSAFQRAQLRRLARGTE